MARFPVPHGAKHTEPGIHPLTQYELATRLSYFLWSTAPDETLMRLAEEDRCQDPKCSRRRSTRMLDDPRSRTFISSFVGQWLGTQDVGGRVVPLLTELQSYYTPETRRTCARSRFCCWIGSWAKTAACWNCSPRTTRT